MNKYLTLRTPALCLAAAVLTAPAMAAPGDQWRAVSWGGNPFGNSLWDYTEGTGNAVNRRQFNLPNGLIHGIDYGANGTLYAAATFNDFGIYTVTESTGQLNKIATFGGVAEGGMTYDKFNDRLLVSIGPFDKNIYQIDLANNNQVSVFASATGYDDIQGLAVDEVTGDIWALHSLINSSGASELLKWNGTGFTSWGFLPFGMGVNSGMDFNGANELHILSNGGALFKVGLTFGSPSLTFVENVANTAGEGYTSIAAVPEPATMSALAVGLVGLLRRRAKRGR